ncbi:hypothetical protein [Bacillus vallismortis]|uniref:hypothetical protein n=1 Tax=Bacillus vallismortis TaxID=72361 RepID=UPI00227FC44A|nr:hypothetical protein [Bacillus vallismortis]MCY7919569.1 hypothetical protein [Bacillus vallismortis]
MPFTKELPEWGNPGQRPPQSSIDQGYKPMDHPPADWFNWYQYTAYQALKELQTIGATKDDVSTAVTDAKAYTDKHEKRTDNPHKTTKAQVGLGNVDNVQQASKTDFDAHTKDNDRHITATERTNWNAKETTTGAQNKAYTAEKNAKTYTDQHINDKSNPHGVTKDQVGLSNVINDRQATKTEFDTHVKDSAVHISTEERTKWNNAQLYKFINDYGKRTKLADGTDLLTLPSGFYFAPGHVILNNPTSNDSSWFNYDVIESDQGRKTIYAWRSHDNTIWHSTVHTYGVFKGWKRIITADDLEPAWTEVPLKNGAKHGDRKVMCATVGGLLYLQGEIVTNRGVIFGTLPASYRPAQLRSRIVPIFGTTGMTKLYIEDNGNMRLEGQISDKLENITSYGLDEIIPL